MWKKAEFEYIIYINNKRILVIEHKHMVVNSKKFRKE